MAEKRGATESVCRKLDFKEENDNSKEKDQDMEAKLNTELKALEGEGGLDSRYEIISVIHSKSVTPQSKVRAIPWLLAPLCIIFDAEIKSLEKFPSANFLAKFQTENKFDWSDETI